MEHEKYMLRALQLAQKAADLGEVPVGALIVYKNQIISEAFNQKETTHSALKHAELIAIEQASKHLSNWRLLDCTLYVTLEPCVMCAGAIVAARIPHLVYGAADPKGGGVNSVYQILTDPRLNHQTLVTSQIYRDECSHILSHFFKKRRECSPC